MQLWLLAPLAVLLICNVCEADDESKYCKDYKDRMFTILTINKCHRKICYRGKRFRKSEGCEDPRNSDGKFCKENGESSYELHTNKRTCTVRTCVTTEVSGEFENSLGCQWEGQCKSVDSTWLDQRTCTHFSCRKTPGGSDVAVKQDAIDCIENIYYGGAPYRRCVSHGDRFYVKNNILHSGTICTCVNGSGKRCKMFVGRLKSYIKDMKI